MKRAVLEAILLCTMVATACSRKLVAGVVLPETGEAAVYGASIKSGLKVAFDEATAAHSAPEGLQIEYRDSASDPAQAATILRALFDDGALIAIGGVTSPEANAMIPIAERWERVLLSPSASAPDLARRSTFFFRVFPSDDLEGVKAADLLALTRNARTVLIVQEDNTYSRGLLKVFVGEYQNQGGRVVGSVRTADPGWDRQVRDVLATQQPAAVYICGYGDAIIEVLRIIRSASFEGAICTTSALNTATLLQRAGQLAEGVLLPLSGFDAESREEPIRSFVEHYRLTYGLTPDIYAAHGYDAALVCLSALRGSRTRDGSEVQMRIKGLSDTRGVTGLLAFDDYGNIKHYPRSHWIRGGRVEDYDAHLERERSRREREQAAVAGAGGGGR
jgi:branched-chain amino acid transport system substrate-binding protein